MYLLSAYISGYQLKLFFPIQLHSICMNVYRHFFSCSLFFSSSRTGQFSITWPCTRQYLQEISPKFPGPLDLNLPEPHQAYTQNFSFIVSMHVSLFSVMGPAILFAYVITRHKNLHALATGIQNLRIFLGQTLRT